MAKNRLLYDIIILSRKLNNISEGAENLWYRLLVLADDYGRYHAEASILQGKAYTLRKTIKSIIEKRLKELINIGLIKLYQIDGETYLELTGFEKYQKFRKDVKRKEEYPAPVTYTEQLVTSRNASLCLHRVRVRVKSKSKEEENKELLIKIISYFNEKVGQKRSFDCEETNKLIYGRLNQGYNFEDFKHIINVKVAQWKEDPKMERYLRPSTLFRLGHFEEYLNEKMPKETKKLTEQEQKEEMLQKRYAHLEGIERKDE